MITYIYATDREDGLRFSVGQFTGTGPANGRVALFERAEDAELFAQALQTRDGGQVLALPSATR